MLACTQTVTAKLLGVGVLALLMTIPLMQVRALVSERQQLRETAIAQIAPGWGGRPVLPRCIDWYAYVRTSTEPPAAIMERS